MRYVVVGPGAVGGTIGGRLHEGGFEVVLVARGAHYEALARNGLLLRDPERARVLAVPVVDRPGRVEWRHDDVVVLATKTQDSTAALDAVRASAPGDVAVVCAQNGVENERLAARRFPDVYGVCVMLPAAHLEPGVVTAYSAPAPGILDVGRYPSGTDGRAERISAELTACGFSSLPQAAIMRWKYGKLLMNLGNALEAACGPSAREGELSRLAREEGVACFTAAGIDVAAPEEDRRRRGRLVRPQPVDGLRRGGGSTWQSLARATGTVEVDYLNGEVVLLGRILGISTPANALLQRVAHDMARRGAPPGSHDHDALVRTLDGRPR